MLKRVLKNKRIRKWVEKQTETLKEKPRFTTRLFIGLFLVIFSFVVNYFGLLASSSLAIYFSYPEIALFGVPGFYGLSWLIWIFGMFLLGKANYDYANYKLANYLKNKYLNYDNNN